MGGWTATSENITMSVFRNFAKHSIQTAASLASIRWRHSEKDHAIGLTFDDGPTPEHTPALLDLLDKYGARATFFVIGSRAEQHSDIATEIIKRGHTLGNHSFAHKAFARLPIAKQLEEIRKTDAILSGIDQKAEHAFRPPQGILTFPLMFRLGLLRQRIQMWTVDSNDYERNTDLARATLAKKQLTAGDVVLFHDDGPVAAEVLEEFLPRWQSAGLAAQAVNP